MRRIFEVLSFVGILGYLLCRIFFYEETETMRYLFGGAALLGFIGRVFLRERKTS
ncbi:hypothetical protein SAMN04487969_1083 [Paenibacillus algorifonticola]|uniref:Uncharacterized protein n=1 Tax=Paenibacillus algorifonticola TaxID=684063 RepID=A0A1I2DXR3_9BACL|nr:hypothetical protein SAMN04487969_1083 [Paenibacillus algorifonticola]